MSGRAIVIGGATALLILVAGWCLATGFFAGRGGSAAIGQMQRCLEEGRWDDLEELATAWLDEPEAGAPYFLARAQLGQGKLREARSSFLLLDPGDPLRYYWLSVVDVQRFQRDTLRNLRRTSVSSLELNQNLDLLRRAVDDLPAQKVEHLQELEAWALALECWLSSAGGLYGEVLAMRPADPLLWLAILADAEERWRTWGAEELRDLWLEHEDEMPQDEWPDGLGGRVAWLHFHAGDYDRAADMRDEWDPDEWITAALRFLDRGDLEGARRALDVAKRSGPDDPVAAWIAGYLDTDLPSGDVKSWAGVTLSYAHSPWSLTPRWGDDDVIYIAVGTGSGQDELFSLYSVDVDEGGLSLSGPSLVMGGLAQSLVEPSPTGHGVLVVLADESGLRWRRRPAIVDGDGAVVRELAVCVEVLCAAWAPDGSAVAYACPEGLFVVSADGGEPREIADTREPEERIRSIAWSPDGRHLAYGLRTRTRTEILDIHVVSMDDGTSVTHNALGADIPAFDAGIAGWIEGEIPVISVRSWREPVLHVYTGLLLLLPDGELVPIAGTRMGLNPLAVHPTRPEILLHLRDNDILTPLSVLVRYDTAAGVGTVFGPYQSYWGRHADYSPDGRLLALIGFGEERHPGERAELVVVRLR